MPQAASPWDFPEGQCAFSPLKLDGDFKCLYVNDNHCGLGRHWSFISLPIGAISIIGVSKYLRSGFNLLVELSMTWRRNPYHIYDFTVQIQEIALFINVLFLGVPMNLTEATLIKSSQSRHSELIATAIVRFSHVYVHTKLLIYKC